MKKLLTLGLVLLLIMPVVLGYVYLKPEDIKFRAGGVQRLNEYFYDARVRNQITVDQWVYLTPPEPPIFATGQPPFYPRGTAQVTSVRSAYQPKGSVTIKVKDLRPSSYDNTYYQAWLYDSRSGGYLNLGMFEAIMGGVGELEIDMTNYFDAYDMVMITREPRDDSDPRPTDDIVLLGKIMKNQYYEPMPVLGAKAQYGWSYYSQ
jgi:hypothetical protein